MRPTPPVPPFDEATAEARLTANRQDAVALMAKADHRFIAGDLRAASGFYRMTLALPARGAAVTQSDLARAQATTVWLDAEFKRHMLKALDTKGVTKANRHPRFQKSLDIMLGERPRDPTYERYPERPMSYFYPDLPYVAYADPETMAWVPAVEGEFPAMRAEAEALIGDDGLFRPYAQSNAARPQGDVHGLLDKADWSTSFLFENGAAVAERVARAPVTFQTVIDHAPLCRITKRAPSIMLSLLRPGARIPPHTGMLNTRLICHLPLIVPPDCGFRVGGEVREWQEGRLLIFDDTVEHEAWNNSKENRLVLIFDVWRSELSAEERAQIVALFEIVDDFATT